MLTAHGPNRDVLFESAPQLHRENVVLSLEHRRRRRKRHSKSAYQDRERILQLSSHISAVVRSERLFEPLNERTAIRRL